MADCFQERGVGVELLVVKTVRKKTELDEIAKLRYKRICEELQYKDPSLFPDKKEFDKYDRFSTHFVAIRGQKVIGTDRLVADSKLGFPMEEKFKLPSYLDRTKTRELSRLVIDNDFCHNPSVLLRLFGENYRYSKKQGITHWCAAVDEPLLENLLKIGFCFLLIGEKSCFDGPDWDSGSLSVPAVPVLLDIAEAELYLRSTNPRLYERITGDKVLQSPGSHEKREADLIRKRNEHHLRKLKKAKT